MTDARSSDSFDIQPDKGPIPRLLPTGSCWCGCGTEATIGAFFARGHDKKAESDLLRLFYPGGVAELLYRHGFGPHRSLDELAVKEGVRERCPECGRSGSQTDIRLHRTKDHGVAKPLHGCTFDDCSFSANTEAGLRRHLNFKHTSGD